MAFKTLEKFQLEKDHGLYQSPGDASIAETALMLLAMKESGIDESNEQYRQAKKYILDYAKKVNGPWGMTEYNEFFPDCDMTQLAIVTLDRILTPEEKDKASYFKNAIKWMYQNQNHDGGFPTWGKDKIPGLGNLIQFNGLVLGESVVEHTARAITAFSRIDQKYRDQASIDRAMKYLISKQKEDGSFV